MRISNIARNLAWLGIVAVAPVTAAALQSPHWSPDGCVACHADAAPKAPAPTLLAEDAEALCESCHGDRGGATPCRHSSNIPAADGNVHASLTPNLKNGKLVCSTCHDVVFQCERPKIHYSYQNRGFLRDRTSRNAPDYCVKCHQDTAIERLNPHGGTAGQPPRPTCQLCHDSIPETAASGSLDVRFNMSSDLNEMCTGCHVTRPHPRSMTFSRNASEGWVHFVQPSDEVLENLRQEKMESGVELPLDPGTGKIFCATCHNPHDFKIGGEHGSEERNAEHRLRTNNICQVCHDK